MSRIPSPSTPLPINRRHLPLQQLSQSLPPLPPPLHPILPLPNLYSHKRLMPLPQAFKARHLTQLQEPNLIITQRSLQFYLFQPGLRIRQYTQYLPIDLEAVEQVREVAEIWGGGVLAVDVQPDQAFGVDGAAEDLGQVERVDVGEAGADEGQGGVVVCG